MGGRIVAQPRPEGGAEFSLELEPYLDEVDANEDDDSSRRLALSTPTTDR